MTLQPQIFPQSGVQGEREELKTARFYIRWMLDNDAHTDLVPNVGRWNEAFRALHTVHKIGGRAAARKAFSALCKDDPSLIVVVSGEKDTITYPVPDAKSAPITESMVVSEPVPEAELSPVPPTTPEPASVPPATPVVEPSQGPSPTAARLDDAHDPVAASLSFQPLPAEVRLPEELGATASPWLDAYIDFSRKWSPRGYEGFHEAVALWVLSTVAARRVMVPLGDKYYTPLLIVLVGRTGLFAKSTTAKIGRAVLSSADLEWLLAADDATPQKFISEMAGCLPSNYASLSPQEQQDVQRQLAFAGQRGWFYDEFGQIMNAIMKDGVMSEFRGILRRLDDCYKSYKYGTISRGTEIVQNPYLALLGSMTPDDLGKAAKSGSPLWGDGFLARFAFVTPPGKASGGGRFPEGLRVVPEEISAPLRAWHRRLGIPEISIRPIVDGKGKASGGSFIERSDLPEQCCTLAPDVIDSYYAYSDALTTLRASTNKNRDLDGSYNRFASKALRIAMLLASLENDGHIEQRHWARGQAISERWRAGVHDLFAQTNETPADEGAIMEEKILQIVEKLKLVTVREIRQHIYGIDAARLHMKVHDLVRIGMLEEVECGKTIRYRIPPTSSA
ncbi:MAG: DUF3987 domain-containing protein [Ktedonobacteraceae bacterium]|nr:DUF3987 domain-containing protein [Ktedonobacteraceae bacterium]